MRSSQLRRMDQHAHFERDTRCRLAKAERVGTRERAPTIAVVINDVQIVSMRRLMPMPMLRLKRA
jgi:hypothetical protein